MRRSRRLTAATLTLLGAPLLALAQTRPPPPPLQRPPASPPAASAPAGTDPVIAKVGPDQIHASDLADAAQGLPEQLRGMPPSMLYPMLLDQLVDRDVIVLAARKQGLQNDPAVQRSITRATNTVLQNALLTREIAPTLTDAAIQARYDKDYANKPGEEEVRAEPHPGRRRGEGEGHHRPARQGRGFRRLGEEEQHRPVRRARTAASSAGSRRATCCRSSPTPPSRSSPARSPRPRSIPDSAGT